MVGPKFNLKCTAPVSKFRISSEKSAKIFSFFRATCNLLIETNWLDWVERMRNVGGQSKILAGPHGTEKLSITKKGIALKLWPLIKNDKCTISKIRLCWTHSKFCHKMTHCLCSMSNWQSWTFFYSTYCFQVYQKSFSSRCSQRLQPPWSAGNSLSPYLSSPS